MNHVKSVILLSAFATTRKVFNAFSLLSNSVLEIKEGY